VNGSEFFPSLLYGRDSATALRRNRSRDRQGAVVGNYGGPSFHVRFPDLPEALTGRTDLGKRIVISFDDAA
jgi:hypothetical protein